MGFGLSAAFKTEDEVKYIDAVRKSAVEELGAVVYNLMRENVTAGERLVILCIGSDRATGDCLGPITGQKLTAGLANGAERGGKRREPSVYGTLERPVHARNIHETVKRIYNENSDPFIIAIDACLGKPERIGCITVGRGGVAPGAGLNKRLPAVGSAFITGVVNHFSGAFDFAALQNTRLGLVMKMADVISEGVLRGLHSSD